MFGLSFVQIDLDSTNCQLRYIGAIHSSKIVILNGTELEGPITAIDLGFETPAWKSANIWQYNEIGNLTNTHLNQIGHFQAMNPWSLRG